MTGFNFGRVAQLITALIASTLASLSIAAAGASAATTDFVCPVCSYTTIQSAINAAGTGDTIKVAAGVYTETLDVNKSVTIEGAGAGNTIIEADTATLTDRFDVDSGALTDYPIVYADAANVTIEDLTVDGLDDAALVGGRFEGIAEYNNNLTVDDVHVTGMSDSPPSGVQTGYGILAINDGSTPRSVTVMNSRISDYQKNGITVDGNSDVTVNIAGNTIVGDGPAAIGDNGIEVYDLWWESSPPAGPLGTVTANDVTGNVCTVANVCGPDLLGDGYKSGDSNIEGDAAGVLIGNASDLTLSGNTVSANDIGIWSTTSPGATTTISSNTISGNLYADVLAGYGQSTVSANTIGSGPDSTAGLAGVLIAGYAGDPSAANAAVTANTISGTDAGVEVAQGETPGAPTPSAIVENNAISGNTQGIENKTTASITAPENWFGCNGGPAAAGCDTVTGSGAAHVTSSPFLVLDVTPLPATITPGSTATVLASIRQDSAGNSFTTGAFPSGIPVNFAATAGSIGTSATLTNGDAVTTVSGTPVGSATITATLDNQSSTASLATANAVSSTSSTSTSVVTVTVPASVPPLISFLNLSSLSLLASHPGSELAVTCVDGCSASVAGTIALREKHGKHRTLSLSSAQLTIAAGGASVYAVSLSSSQRSAVKNAVSASLTLNVTAKDDTTGKTLTGSKSFTLTRS